MYQNVHTYHSHETHFRIMGTLFLCKWVMNKGTLHCESFINACMYKTTINYIVWHCALCTDDDYGLTIIQVYLMVHRFIFMFGIRSNNFIGDQRNYAWVVVTITTLLVVWITSDDSICALPGHWYCIIGPSK
jgi:hypothetical protein